MTDAFLSFAKDWDAGMSGADLAAKYGCRPETISRRAKRMGLKSRHEAAKRLAGSVDDAIAQARTQAIDDCIKVAMREMDKTHRPGHGHSEYASGYQTAAEHIASRLEALKEQ